jgi:hypothetical protein
MKNLAYTRFYLSRHTPVQNNQIASGRSPQGELAYMPLELQYFKTALNYPQVPNYATTNRGANPNPCLS